MANRSRDRKHKHGSALLGLLDRQSKRLYEAFAQSALARFLCSYHKLEEWTSDSFFVSRIRKISLALKAKLRKSPRRELASESFDRNEVGIFLPSSLHKSFKTRLSEAIEGSVFAEKAVSFIRMLFSVPMISYGVFLFAFGLTTTVIRAFLFFMHGQASGSALDLFTGLVLVLLSLPAMFKGYEPLIDCLQKSVFGSLILRSVFGIQNEPKAGKSVGNVNFLLFLTGVIFGVLTWFLPPMYLVLLIAGGIIAIGVLFVPEAGLLLLFVVFPFLGDLSHTSIACALAVLYVGGCWLIKVLLGKRSISVDLNDALVLCLMLMVFLSGFAGGEASMQSALLYLAMMFGYLITANLLRSKLWIKRCSNGLILSSFAVALYGLVQWMQSETVVSVFGSQLILGCYLLSVIPLTLARLNAVSGYRGRFHYLIALLVQSACVLATQSRLAWAILLIELVGYGLLASRKTIPLLLTAILLIPIVSCITPLFGVHLPEWIASTVQGRGQATLDLLAVFGEAPLTGIGMSDSLLLTALSEGSHGLMPELGNTYLRLAVQLGLPGLLLFCLLVLVWYLASFSLISGNAGKREKCYTRGWIIGLTGMMVMGTFCYLWADYRLLMLFWCMAGLYQAVRKYSIEHESRTADTEIPPHDVQWVNLDLYFDSTGSLRSSEYRSAESEKGGNSK